MNPFVFRLERLLHLRLRAEREKAKVLGQAVREEIESRRQVETATTDLGRCGEQVEEVSRGVARAGTLQNLALAVKAAAQRLQVAADSHQAAIKEVEVAQERFGEARQQRRVIERLREHRHEAWTQEVTREEQKDHDDSAINRRQSGGKQ